MYSRSQTAICTVRFVLTQVYVSALLNAQPAVGLGETNMRAQNISVGLTRRRILQLGTKAAAFGAFSSFSRAWSASGSARWPRGVLGGTAAQKVDERQFLDLNQMRGWYEELDGRGLRATGSRPHEQYIDTLQERMERVGIQQVRTESAPFDRWTPSSWGIDILSGTDAGSIPVASYVPYSGQLPAEGFTAPLVYVKPESVPPGSLKGKLALIDIDIPPTKLNRLMALANDRYDPAHMLNPERDYVRVWLGNMLVRFAAVRAAAPAAVIAILPLDDAAAAGMYTPYDGIVRSTPGLYVARAAGARLKRAATAGVPVKIRLSAQVDHFTGRNLVGLIPGHGQEAVILHSHTDGPNGIEDNGPDLIIAMAQYLARIPPEQLPRSIQIVLTTGHFAGGAGARAFVRQHREDLLPKVAASVTVEHVGAMDWALAQDGSLHPTELLEPAVVFMPPDASVLAGEVTRGLASGGMGGTLLAGPTNPKPKSMDTDPAWPGEGEYMWNNGGLPAANYICGPNYLFNSGYPTVNCVDFAMMRRATMGFVDLALNLTRVPKDKLRVPQPGDPDA